MVEKLAVDFINHKGRILVVDGYAGWDPQERIKIRTYCTRTYHALFMRNMLITPTEKELQEDFTRGVHMNIFNAGELMCSKNISGVNTTSLTALDLVNRKISILGTQYAGETNKAIFKTLQYYYPRKGLMTFHGAATVGTDNKTTLMCGLSGSGKTALAVRSRNRKLLADDELCWGDKGIFNINGGCYAKVSNLEKEVEPEIYNSIKFGSICENVSFYKKSRDINFNDNSITENSRVSFPLNYLD